jgi:MYXO-CTERM domain-containing protein
MRPRLLLPLLALPWLAGCAPDSGGPPSDGLGQRRSPIISGTLDTTRQSVIALLRVNGGQIIGECSGTVVAVDKATSTGYVLTAAHCVQPEKQGDPTPLASEYLVAQGNDYATKGTVYYPVQDYKIHPSYALFVVGSPYDFAMVKFAGANPAKTPSTPPISAAEDNLAVSSPITAVGFGVTVGDQSQGNTLRWYIDKPLWSITPFKLGMNEAGGGICFGDSGGPWMTVVNGVEKIAGVSSYVEGQCNGNAYAGRVSLITDDFILPYINAQTGNQTCSECQQSVLSAAGACTDAYKACQGNADCAALLQCLGACNSDQACATTCFTAHPAGHTVYNQINSCVCTTGCPKACAMECAPPKCGFSTADTCGACLGTSCCAQGAACAADPTCAACNSTMSPANCAANPAQHELSYCLASQCGSACSSAKCGLSADPTCQGCFEASCCAEAQACTQDKTCFLCTTGQLAGADCAESGLVKSFYQCLGQSCSTPCNVPEVGGTGGMGGMGGMGGAGGDPGGAGGTGGSSGSVQAGGAGSAGAAAGQAGAAGQGGQANGGAGQAGAGGGGSAGHAGATAAGSGGQAAGHAGTAGGGAAGQASAGAAGSAQGGAGTSASGAAGSPSAAGAGAGGSTGGAGSAGGAGGAAGASDSAVQPASSADSGGCGCRVGATDPATPGAWLGALALAGLRWRRRSRR